MLLSLSIGVVVGVDWCRLLSLLIFVDDGISSCLCRLVLVTVTVINEEKFVLATVSKIACHDSVGDSVGVRDKLSNKKN